MENSTTPSLLSRAINILSKDQSPLAIQSFAEVLAKYSDESTWVAIPLEEPEGTFEPILFEEVGKAYVGMYSANPGSRFPGIVTDINKLFHVVFSNDFINGIVIDPESAQLFLEKEFILHCLSLCKHRNYLPQPE